MKKLLTTVLAMSMSLAVFAGCDSGSQPAQTNPPPTNPAVAGDEPAAPVASNFDLSSYISVISREDGSGTRGAFIELFGIEVSDGSTKTDMTTKEAIIADKTDIMMTNISSDPYSIGYISLGSLNTTVKAMSINGVEATVENIENGSYEIQRPFNIAISRDGISEVSQDFVDFILSADGQAVVAGSYIAVDGNAPDFESNMASGKVVVSGSSSVTPIMEKLREAYLLVNTNATVEVQMTDSSAGMISAANGSCDIGMASRELKDSELENLDSIAIAIDGIAVIVNNQNSIDNLTSEQVRQIFTGEVEIWNEVQ